MHSIAKYALQKTTCGLSFFVFLNGQALAGTDARFAPIQILAPDQSDEALGTSECKDWLQYLGLGRGRGVLRSDGVMVVKNGKALLSVNKEPFTETKSHPLWSASKSVTSAILGAAVQAKLKHPSGSDFSLEDLVTDYLPLQNDGKNDPDRSTHFKNLKVRHLLEMGSGFKWSESYESGILGSNVLHMLYLDSYTDMATYVLSQPFADVGPGQIYNYSSGDVSVALAVLKKSCAVTPGCDYESLPWKLLFEPLGMQDVTFETDGSGVFVGSSYVHMSLLDMAKFGLLYLNDGKFGGKQILPTDFVSVTRKPNPSYESSHTVIKDILAEGVYGLTWYLNLPAKGFKHGSYQSWPEDMYAALGHYGQLILVVPSMNLVVVRTGSDIEYNSKINTFGTKFFPCLEKFSKFL